MLETARLRLRPWRDDDVEAWADMNADPRVMEFFVEPTPREHSYESAARLRAGLERNGYGWWVIERKGVPGFAGVVVVDDIHWDAPFQPLREIGWRLPVHSWGQGFATEAASKALRFAFEVLRWPEIVAMTARSNVRSQRVMEKLGMTRDLSGDFDHPRVPIGHRIRPHVLYRATSARAQAPRAAR